MDAQVDDNDQVDDSRGIVDATTTLGNVDEDDNSDDDESYKSCADPFSVSTFPPPPPCQIEQADKDIPQMADPQGSDLQLRCPPNVSDDSADTFSDNGSDKIYYSEIENNDNDSDISNPGRENLSTNPGEIEISFQRELLDYLGSFFNVESRFRLRENRQSVNVSEEQLSEYDRLRTKVDKELKIMGVGNNRDLASSEQNIARNLYFLLAARERGDWTSCRRYSRVVPMWSFEKREKRKKKNTKDKSSKNKTDRKEEWTTGKVTNRVESGAEEYEKDWDTDGSHRNSDNDCVYSANGTSNHMDDHDVIIDDIDGQDKDDDGDAKSHDAKGQDAKHDKERHRNTKNSESDATPSTVDKKMGKLIFKNTRRVKYLRDVPRHKKGGAGTKKEEGDRHLSNRDKSGSSDASEASGGGGGGDFDYSVVESERVQRDGAWDIRSAVYGSRWAVRRLGLESRFSAHEGCVNALAFSASGAWIASGSDDRHLVITDWQRRQQLARFSVGHASNIFQVRFLPGSSDLELVSCSRDASVRYAALSSAGQLQYSRLLARHNGYCHKLDVPLDQPSLVISAGEDACVLASDVRAARAVGQLCRVDKVPLYTICCSPVRSQEFAVAGKDSRVFVFDRRNATSALFELCPDALAGKARGSYHVTSVAYRGDGQAVLASYNDDDIYLLSTASDAANGTLHRYQGHRNVQTVTGVAFYGPQHEFVVSGSNDGHVLLWERDTEALVNWFRADENGVVNVLEPHPTVPMLATAGLDHDVKLWSMLAADGDYCCGGGGDGEVAGMRRERRSLPLERPLLELDAETARIDYAWRKLDEQQWPQHQGQSQWQHGEEHRGDVAAVPFDLHNLKVITALNWKMRDDAYPYSIDNNLDNLIFMSRRRRGESQFRGVFISDSDSADSYDSLPEQGAASPTSQSTADNANSSTVPRPSRHLADANRPDGCRSS